MICALNRLTIGVNLRKNDYVTRRCFCLGVSHRLKGYHRNRKIIEEHNFFQRHHSHQRPTETQRFGFETSRMLSVKLGFTTFLNKERGTLLFRCVWHIKILLLNAVQPRRMPHAHSALIPYGTEEGFEGNLNVSA